MLEGVQKASFHGFLYTDYISYCRGQERKQSLKEGRLSSRHHHCVSALWPRTSCASSTVSGGVSNLPSTETRGAIAQRHKQLHSGPAARPLLPSAPPSLSHALSIKDSFKASDVSLTSTKSQPRDEREQIEFWASPLGNFLIKFWCKFCAANFEARIPPCPSKTAKYETRVLE